MRTREKQIKYTEATLIAFIWVVLLCTPVLFREENNNPLWRSVAKQLEILVPLSVLFIINRFFLVPRMLFKHKIKKYILCLLGVILLLTLGSYLFDVSTGMTTPPGQTGANNPARPPRDTPADNMDPGPPQPGKRQPRPVPPFANFLIFSFLIVGFDTGLRSGLRWIEVENEKMKLEKENVSNQLALLKTQVSPHFFMNTLNNIHSLVDSNAEEAQKIGRAHV